MNVISRRKLVLPIATAAVALLSAMAWTPASICGIGGASPNDNKALASITLARFSTCNQLERKVLYRNLSQLQRREMWREHWESFLGPDTKLTPDQQRTVRLALSNLDHYTSPSALANRKALEGDGFTSKKLKAQFGDSLAIALFAILGPEPQFTGHNLAQLLQAASVERNSGPFLSASLPPYCTCSTESDWCCQGTCDSGYDCITSESGCGTVLIYGCSGLCGT